MSQKYKGQIPFDKDGNLMSYADNTLCFRPFQWRDNYEFEAKLKICDCVRGRSAARFRLRDEDGHEYEMFMKDMLNLIQDASNIRLGEVLGIWTFCKRGCNYGICWIGEADFNSR